ncbi:hypothetical protein [Lacticaseibacillus mingshuiensis]|uniref:Uncharacterized protein n=1 Tax=Lacticaseibacillus mingshuiensis TaxID=2799574 RepID=A0ABW4CGX6_9LACO|nr:hypothetical protein [Lacticaseibacillus mingshuiensis]
MWRLIEHQTRFFWATNWRRFTCFIGLAGLMIGGAAWQSYQHPHFELAKILLGGNAPESSPTHIVFPVTWVVLLLLPVLALGDTIPELWRRRGIQIWGHVFSRRQFALVDLLLIAEWAGAYWLLLAGGLVLGGRPVDGWYLATLFGVVWVMLLIETWLSWGNRFAGLLAMLSWQVITIYTTWPTILPFAMLIRCPRGPVPLVITLGVLIILSGAYTLGFWQLIGKWSDRK